jgi:4-amino-4-deoxy-L-arabinose transferase-like glycosyltransferase
MTPSDRQEAAYHPWTGTLLVLVVSLAATVPTTGDFGLTWDEPAYRYSQLVSGQWWEQVASARSMDDLDVLLDADTLLYHWPYGRHGINFHPPLSGQLNLLTYGAFGGWMKDVPARRMASVFEYVIAITVLYRFLARRYGVWAGLVAAGSLLTMPRVYGHGHIAGTDTPGMTLWLLTAVATWKGLTEPNAGRWRAAVGVLLGLAFLVKMAAVMVLLPVLAWLVVAPLPRDLRRGGWLARLDALNMTAALLAPLAIAFLEIRRLAEQLPEPAGTNLFFEPPGAQSRLPGAILLAPLAIWILRWGIVRGWRSRAIERPALEILWGILAFAPAVGWLGNPAWWRETLPRLAHYYMLNVDREGALPDIRIYYLGETYLFSLPWHNGWVLLAVTVPVSILIAGAVGLGYALRVAPRDRLPLYFLVHFLTLPVLRMLPTPAHDGIRLMLPTFPFLAAFAGWGAVWLADGLARLARRGDRPTPFRAAVATLVVGWSMVQLVLIHPFELSYYNRLVGGPSGAWSRGFELSYWYDAFTPDTLTQINEEMPVGAAIGVTNEYSRVPTFAELQSLGALRSDLRLDSEAGEDFPFTWLLRHDSKANPYSRLLFAMRPYLERRPAQLGGLRVAAVSDPEDSALALALQLLASDSKRPRPIKAPLPDWLRSSAPWLSRFWGEGLTRPDEPGVYEPIFSWAATDPESLRAAARALAEGRDADAPDAAALRSLFVRYGPGFYAQLRTHRPRAIVDAVELIIERPDDLRRVLTSPGYTDPMAIGGPLGE